jgi:hypothetical protein
MSDNKPRFCLAEVVAVFFFFWVPIGGPMGLPPPFFYFGGKLKIPKSEKREEKETISVTLFFQRSLKSPSSITMLTSRHKISPIMAT